MEEQKYCFIHWCIINCTIIKIYSIYSINVLFQGGSGKK